MYASARTKGGEEPKYRITQHACTRRLAAVGATSDDCNIVFGPARCAVELVMIRELHAARLLNQSSHRLVAHPERVRTNTVGKHFWVNDLLYIVDRDRVVTICILDAAQIDSLEQNEHARCPATKIPLWTRDQFMDAVLRAMKDAAPDSGTRKVSGKPLTVWEPLTLASLPTVDRSRLRIPRWFLARGSLSLLLVPPHAVVRGQAREIVTYMTRWMRRELNGGMPDQLWFDPSSEVVKKLPDVLPHTRCAPLSIDSLVGPFLTNQVARQTLEVWDALFQIDAPRQGNRVVVVTPSTAYRMLKLAIGPVKGKPAARLRSTLATLLRPDFAKWGRRVLKLTPNLASKGPHDRFTYEIHDAF